ncbi:MAG: 2-dehydropantoate 2-reductase [Desulfobacterales bacterium]
MKIAVVGAGAMGSLFGGLLAEAGNEAWLYDVSETHVDKVKADGLTIEREGRSRSVDICATTNPQEIGPAELVIIFVKSTQTQKAAQTAGLLAGSQGFVMTLQNGMGNADTIATVIDPNRILAGTTSHGATLLGPGRIRHAGSGPTVMGLWSHSESGFKRAREFALVLSGAGFETQVTEEVRHIIWDKLLVNIGINALTALTGTKNGEILDLETTRELSRAAVAEAVSVAEAQGIEVRQDPVGHVFKIAAATAVNRSSMGQDIDNRRQTEIDAINGFIVREARRLGLEAPVNQTLTALIETLQYHY